MKKIKKEKPVKTVSVLSRVILFTVFFLLAYFIFSYALSSLFIFVTGINIITEFPLPVTWGVEFVSYLLVLIMITGLLFGPKVRARVADENIPKLIKAVSITFAVLIIIITGLGLIIGSYGIINLIIYLLVSLSVIVLGLLFINKTLSGSLKVNYLYYELGLAAVAVILVIGFFASGEVFVITTGRYGHGTPEDNELADIIYGPADTQERFNIYFNYYNVVHETGHGIIRANSDITLDPVDEEQLVNDFAASFWSYYGEDGMIEKLNEIVSYALNSLESPADAGVSHMQFARENWNKPEMYTFNNYGWFQYSCVTYSLNNIRPLEDILSEMGVSNIRVQPRKTLAYDSYGEEMIGSIIRDVVLELNDWGVMMRPIYHRLSNNPSTHNLFPTRNTFGILGVLHNHVY